MPRLRSIFLCFLVLTGVGGCAGEEMFAFPRDSGTLYAEIADSMIPVVDDATSERWLANNLNRFIERKKTLKKRADFYTKLLTDEKKKKIFAYTASGEKEILDGVLLKLEDVMAAEEYMKRLGFTLEAAKDAPPPKDAKAPQASDKELMAMATRSFPLNLKMMYNLQRILRQEGRIRTIMNKLVDERYAGIVAAWKAAGNAGLPPRRVGPGQEIDPEKEWPNLYKMADVAKEMGWIAENKAKVL